MILDPQIAWYRVHSANSIHSVAPFLRAAHQLIDNERGGRYPGGRPFRFARTGLFGGVMLFWIKRAAKVGLYNDALKPLHRVSVRRFGRAPAPCSDPSGEPAASRDPAFCW